MTTKTPKTRDELALGVLNPKTGKRKGGFINMYRVMPNYRDKLTSGELTEDELIEIAYEKADEFINKRSEQGSDGDRIAEAAADLDWRAEQEARYKAEYDWNDANDESALQMLLDLEVQMRALNRELTKAKLSIGDRVELTKEMRNFAKDHAGLQKALGIDRVSRENRRRDEDPMAALKEQIQLGAAYVQQLRDEWVEVAPEIITIDELIARAQHHSGLPQEWITAMLDAHRRLLGVDSTAVVAE